MSRLTFSTLVMISTLLFYNITRSQITDDAIQLTIRNQQDGYWIDSTYAKMIDSLLVAARETADTLNSIHAFPRIVPNKIEVYATGLWANNWHNGNIWTGIPSIDSLGLLFNLIQVIPPQFNNWHYYTLIFGLELFTPGIAEAYKSLNQIANAFTVGAGGNGNDIDYFYKHPVHYLIFSRGWGDCLSGCSNRYFWYVEIMNENGQYKAIIAEERLRENTVPVIYRWNIPDYYSMTMFSDHNGILDSITFAVDWWVRKHAIEGTWRFFVYPHQWAIDSTAKWNILKDLVITNLEDVIVTLNSALSDPDEYVRTSAEAALDTILRVTSIDDDISELPLSFHLNQNYPNPFNPVTTISYQIPETGKVALKIYDILGREVTTLLNEEKPVGRYEVTFDASSLASGVYFYRLRMNNFLETKKMMLIR